MASNIGTLIAIGLAGFAAIRAFMRPTLPVAELLSIDIGQGPLDLEQGESFQLQALGTYDNGSTLPITSQVQWVSSNVIVASVSSSGLLSAQAQGSAQVSAMLGGVVSNTVLVNVLAVVVPLPPSVSITAPTGGQTLTTTSALVQGLAAADPILVIVQVQVQVNGGPLQLASGTTAWARTVTLAQGLNTLRAIATDDLGQTGEASVTVTYQPPVAVLQSIALSPGSLALLEGDMAQLTATGFYSDGSQANITAQAAWASSNPSAATVTAGLVTALAGGSASITAGLGTVTSPGVPVSVTPVATTSVALPQAADFTDQGLVLASGPAGAWDVRLEGAISPATMVKKNGVYYLYYIGADGNRTAPHTDNGPRHRALGVATSVDGINFTKHPGNPVLTRLTTPGNDQEEGIFSAAATIDPATGNVVLYYGALVATGPTSLNVHINIGLAVSADGLNFQDLGYISQQGARVGQGDEQDPVGVFVQNGVWHLYYIDAEAPWALRMLSGPAMNSLTQDVLVLNTGLQVVGGGDISRISDTELAIFPVISFSTWTVQARTASLTQPGVLSSPQEIIDFPQVQHSLFHLDEDRGTWFMYYADLNNNFQIGVMTAPVFGGGSPPPASTALRFQNQSGQHLDFGPAASMNNLAQGTMLFLLTPHVLTGNPGIVAAKQGPGDAIQLLREGNATANRWHLVVRRAVSAQAVDIPAAQFIVGNWYYVAYTWDTLNGGPRAYVGTLSAPLADVTAAPVDGSGAQRDDSPYPFVLGEAVITQGMDVARVMLFNRDLSLAELQAQQFNPQQQGNLVLWSELGQNGTGPQLDLSGQGNNGTVFGATLVAGP